MHNDGKSLKPILKEAYGDKMKKCKKKPFSKLMDKYGKKKGKKYENGGMDYIDKEKFDKVKESEKTTGLSGALSNIKKNLFGDDKKKKK